MKWFCVKEKDSYTIYKVPTYQVDAFKKEHDGNYISNGNCLQDVINDLQNKLSEKHELSFSLFEGKGLSRQMGGKNQRDLSKILRF